MFVLAGHCTLARPPWFKQVGNDCERVSQEMSWHSELMYLLHLNNLPPTAIYRNLPQPATLATSPPSFCRDWTMHCLGRNCWLRWLVVVLLAEAIGAFLRTCEDALTRVDPDKIRRRLLGANSNRCTVKWRTCKHSAHSRETQSNNFGNFSLFSARKITQASKYSGTQAMFCLVCSRPWPLSRDSVQPRNALVQLAHIFLEVHFRRKSCLEVGNKHNKTLSILFLLAFSCHTLYCPQYQASLNVDYYVD